MTAYAAFHLALMRGFLGLFWLFVGSLVLTGLIWLAAWLNHKWAHRNRDKDWRTGK